MCLKSVDTNVTTANQQNFYNTYPLNVFGRS